MKKVKCWYGFIAMAVAVFCVNFVSCTGCQSGLKSSIDSFYVEDVCLEEAKGYLYEVRKEITVSGNSRFVEYVVAKMNEETNYYEEWRKEVRIMAGKMSGPYYLIVSDTTLERNYQTVIEAPEKEKDEQWEISQNMLVYQHKVDFPAEAEYGGNISVFSDVYFLYPDVKFVDSETGWTFEDKPVNSTKLTVDEVKNLQRPDKKLNDGRKLSYVGTYVRTISYVLDNEEIYSSTLENDLYEVAE